MNSSVLIEICRWKHTQKTDSDIYVYKCQHGTSFEVERLDIDEELYRRMRQKSEECEKKRNEQKTAN